MNIGNIIEMAELETDHIGKCFLRTAAPLRRKMQKQFIPHAIEDTQPAANRMAADKET